MCKFGYLDMLNINLHFFYKCIEKRARIYKYTPLKHSSRDKNMSLKSLKAL